MTAPPDRRVLLLALPLLLLACRDKYAVPPDLLGGRVEMEVRDGESFLSADFWSARSGEEFDFARLPVTACILTPSQPTESGFREVGPDIQVSLGPNKVKLEVVKDDRGEPSYQPAQEEWRSFFGESYDVEIGKTRWKSRLRLPRPLRLNSEDWRLSFEQGQPFEISYQPVAADRMLLLLVQGTAGTVCHLGAEGHFRIPATVIDAAPPEGTLELVATDQDRVELAGHSVLLEGLVSVTRPYHRVAAVRKPEKQKRRHGR